MEIKPSKLARDCSLPELEKRFGPFEPSSHLEGYAAYKARRNAERDRLKGERDAAIVAVENWHAAQAGGLTGNDAASELVSH